MQRPRSITDGGKPMVQPIISRGYAVHAAMSVTNFNWLHELIKQAEANGSISFRTSGSDPRFVRK